MKPILAIATMVVFGFAANLLAQPSQSKNPDDNPPRKIVEAQFSPDGQRVITTSKDGTARVWDAQTGKPVLGPLNHVGAWQLASFKYGEATKWSDASDSERHVKFITETHFRQLARAKFLRPPPL